MRRSVGLGLNLMYRIEGENYGFNLDLAPGPLAVVEVEQSSCSLTRSTARYGVSCHALINKGNNPLLVIIFSLKSG